ncbi:MAG: flagellin [Deltaproteobacteria bacterium]|nr:flagellin [Deltaproteobacteria bacterium]
MSLVVNHNMMAMTAARNLGIIYGRLSQSTQRLSSGLRINSAADDAAGLAIRELMRADIAVMQQGSRNASDGISMIQTAEGAMSVIDEKLIRMKELAEQAATGTYTTIQRDIMNSEYQAMAAEIDRIANSTNFAGTKLLDGSVSSTNYGLGLKVHFGTGNSAAEDYYFVKIGDVRATSPTGLRIGGDARTDIWGTAGTTGTGAGGCCGTGFLSMSAPVANWNSGDVFAFGYNWDLKASNSTSALTTGKYMAGMYQMGSGSSLQSLINAVNMGSQARVKIDFHHYDSNVMVSSANGAAHRICLGTETYIWGSAGLGSITGSSNIQIPNNATSAALAFVSAVTASSKSFWAMQDKHSASVVYLFTKAGGNYNSLKACDDTLGVDANSATYADRITWANVETDMLNSAGTNFSLGGLKWGTLQAVPTAAGTYGLTLNGMDVGKSRDLWVLNAGSGAAFDLNTQHLGGMASLAGLTRQDFTQIQDASDGNWLGAHIRTQSQAQEALTAIQKAIERKEIVRANLGAYQNRLENTITNLGIMGENLQASESRISDVDVAVEMTEFQRNNILAQAATAMLAQANSLPQLALTLLK